MTENEKVKIAIFDQLPFTVWASTRDLKLKFWNSVCENRYGFTKEDAIGKNYTELFVNKDDRRQSKLDCEFIVDNDKQFPNFYANDISKDGKNAPMLTNSFRVTLPETLGFEKLQVEFGINYDDIPDEDTKNISEILLTLNHIEKLDKIKFELEMKTQTSFYQVQTYNNKVAKSINDIIHEITTFREEYQRKTVSAKYDLKTIRNTADDFILKIDKKIKSLFG